MLKTHQIWTCSLGRAQTFTKKTLSLSLCFQRLLNVPNIILRTISRNSCIIKINQTKVFLFVRTWQKLVPLTIICIWACCDMFYFRCIIVLTKFKWYIFWYFVIASLTHWRNLERCWWIILATYWRIFVIEVDAKWPPFYRQYFQIQFLITIITCYFKFKWNVSRVST